MATKLGGGAGIFLSASVPKQRTFPPSMEDAELRARKQQNDEYLSTAQPVRIRSAVTALTRLLLTRGMRLVFGAHPAISPMVLSAAQDVAAASAKARDKPRILIFQSDYFKRELPESTLNLASWEAGLLVLTPIVRPESNDVRVSRQMSLHRMRELMVSVPDMRAAVFVGGMDGVEKEAQLFADRNPQQPMYALGSTGSAALKLVQGKSGMHRFDGSLRASSRLSDNPSYSVIAAEILDDLRVRADLT